MNMEAQKCDKVSTERAVFDIHICGLCKSQFNDVTLFLQHKQNGCQSNDQPPQNNLLQLADTSSQIVHLQNESETQESLSHKTAGTNDHHFPQIEPKTVESLHSISTNQDALQKNEETELSRAQKVGEFLSNLRNNSLNIVADGPHMAPSTQTSQDSIARESHSMNITTGIDGITDTGDTFTANIPPSDQQRVSFEFPQTHNHEYLRQALSTDPLYNNTYNSHGQASNVNQQNNIQTENLLHQESENGLVAYSADGAAQNIIEYPITLQTGNSEHRDNIEQQTMIQLLQSTPQQTLSETREDITQIVPTSKNVFPTNPPVYKSSLLGTNSLLSQPPTPQQQRLMASGMILTTNITYPVTPKKTKVRSAAPKKFSCPHQGCNFTTAYGKDLERHNRTHTGERPFVCEYCNKSFNRNDKLKIHLRGHTGEKPYTCSLCNYAATDCSSLKKHTRTHTGERPFKCQVCQYASRNSSQLIVHLRSHTGDSPFQCQQCHAKFKINTDLKRHMRTHTGEKPYTCDECDYRCSVKSNLNSHKRANHGVENALKCQNCEFSTSSKKMFKEHVKSHNRHFRCKICDYLCASKTVLKNHMLTHGNVKPYSCEYCSYTSKQKGNVNTHLRKKHPEQVADRRLQRAANRKKKGAVVSTADNKTAAKRLNQCRQRFTCNQCTASFVREDSLKSHLKQHKDIAALQSTALAVLDLQNPVISSNSSSNNPLPQTETVTHETQTTAEDHDVAENLLQFSLPSSGHGQNVMEVAISQSQAQEQAGPPVSSLSNSQPIQQLSTATSYNYVYAVPQSQVSVTPTVSASHLAQQQQPVQHQVVQAPVQLVSSVGMSQHQQLHSSINPSTRFLPGSMQVFPSIQYPVIRLANGQLYPEPQMLGTQLIAGQAGENVVVLGTPMTGFVGEIQTENIQQLPMSGTISHPVVQQSAQPIQIQTHDQQSQQHKDIPENLQQQQVIASSESVLSSDPNNPIPLSIQLVPQSTELASSAIQLPRFNIEAVSQVTEHTPATVQVLFPAGGQGILQRETTQGFSAQPNFVFRMPNGGQGDNSSNHNAFQSTVVPVQLVHNSRTVANVQTDTVANTAVTNNGMEAEALDTGLVTSQHTTGDEKLSHEH